MYLPTENPLDNHTYNQHSCLTSAKNKLRTVCWVPFNSIQIPLLLVTSPDYYMEVMPLLLKL